MTDFKVTDEAVFAAARALCTINSEVCGVNEQDNWNLCSDNFKNDARAAIEAALPVMFEAVHQQRDAGGHWGDQDEAVKNWWDGRENAPMFRTVYRIKEPK